MWRRIQRWLQARMGFTMVGQWEPPFVPNFDKPVPRQQEGIKVIGDGRIIWIDS